MKNEQCNVDHIKKEMLTMAEELTHLNWGVHGDSTTFQEIGAESMDLLNLTMLIERKYKISLTDISLYSLNTTGELFQIVLQRIDHEN